LIFFGCNFVAQLLNSFLSLESEGLQAFKPALKFVLQKKVY